MRISEANTVLEIATSDIPFPEDIDPEAGGTYVKYYRQE
jgi:hypothetical protein